MKSNRINTNNKNWHFRARKSKLLIHDLLHAKQVCEISQQKFQMQFQQEARSYNIFTNLNRFDVENKLHSIEETKSLELSIPIEITYSPLLSNKRCNSSIEKPIEITFIPVQDNNTILIGGKNIRTIDFHFDLVYIERLAKKFPILINPLIKKMKAGEPFKLSGSKHNLDKEFHDLLEQIQTILNRPVVLFTLLNAYVQSLLLRSLQLITVYGSLTKDQEEDISFNRGKQLILENLGKYPGQEKLQKAACMNRNYFTQKFKNKIGMNPKQYYLEKRREKAIITILNSKNTLRSISDELGYTHPSALTRDIKNETGMSARQLRDFYNKSNLYNSIYQ